MCGIIGIYAHDTVAAQLYDGLIHLQHRGQDAAGLVCHDPKHSPDFNVHHGLGLVQEIFTPTNITKLKGNFGLGHTRYPTAGGYKLTDVQPLYTETPLRIALAHNGNLTNHLELATKLKHPLNSSIDSEVLLQLLATDLEKHQTPNFDTLCHTIKNIMDQAQGSYSVLSLIQGLGLIAFRDPHGIRPLVLGERKNPQGQIDYIIASEPTMFYSLGFQLSGDLAPGELIFIDLKGHLHRRQLSQMPFSPCVFEYVYFARPDSILNGVSVYRARLNMGQNLARAWKKRFPDTLPDVVIPVPFTSNTAALAFAKELNLPYSEGLYKNPFIGRTFIMPDGQKRSRGVRNKLTPQKMEIEGKKILLLDDSLVRGTTSLEIIKMMREHGAQEIYFVLACPPIQHPCFYGIDMPSKQELIAARHSIDEIQDYLGVDKLLYLEISDLVEALTREAKPGPEASPMHSPCMACLNGCYVTGKITQEKSQDLGKQRQQEKVNR